MMGDLGKRSGSSNEAPGNKLESTELTLSSEHVLKKNMKHSKFILGLQEHRD